MIHDLDERQSDYDPETMAFRLSAARYDFQPLQDITAQWDGDILYHEEPSFQTGFKITTDFYGDVRRETSQDINAQFNVGTEKVEQYLGDIVQDLVDQEKEIHRTNRPKLNDSWIEVTTRRGAETIGWYTEPLTQDSLPNKINQIWEELTEIARKEAV